LAGGPERRGTDRAARIAVRGAGRIDAERGQRCAVRLARHAGGRPRAVTLLKAKQKKGPHNGGPDQVEGG